MLANELVDGLTELAVSGLGEGQLPFALHDDCMADAWCHSDVVDRLTGLAGDSLVRAEPEALDWRRRCGRKDLS